MVCVSESLANGLHNVSLGRYIGDKQIMLQSHCNCVFVKFFFVLMIELINNIYMGQLSYRVEIVNLDVMNKNANVV